MTNHASKKDFFYVVVLVLTFITFVVGLTFAIYAWIFSHPEGSSAVYTGTLSIEYLSGNIIDFDLLYPAEKPSIDTTRNVYRNNFKITNSGSLDGVMKVDIDVDVNQFSDKTLKYIVYNLSGDELSEGYIDGTNDIRILDNFFIAGNSTEEFILIVWLNENYHDQNTEMTRSFTGAIKVDASQNIG